MQLYANNDSPNIHVNLTPTDVFDTLLYPGGAVTLHPGPSGEYSVVDWVAPRNGAISVAGAFRGLHSTTTDVHVLLNGIAKFSGTIAGLNDAESFSLPGPLALAAGDRIRFAVGYGLNQNYEQDTTGLDAQISFSAVPEPTALLLAVAALVLSFTGQRHRN
ncbi:MAG: hypothetical protein IT424_01535 [Pirellulales bacterium]|nr:hypothetical protein [Pirellulales bacterium]